MQTLKNKAFRVSIQWSALVRKLLALERGGFTYDETQDLVLTSRALGHSSLLSTKIYIHTTQEHNKKVALVLKGWLKDEKSE
ncbi:tyrosine-type recombinase/integrase [Helicobacter pylori]